MSKKGRSIIVNALLIIFLSGFIWGGRNNFINGTQRVVTILYKSTMRTIDVPISLRPGGGLVLTDDNGALIHLTITYPDGKTLKLSRGEISRRESAAHLKSGVWWITDGGVEYISDKESLRRRKRIFGRW